MSKRHKGVAFASARASPAGDLSVGDPGYNSSQAGAAGGDGADWWSAEGGSGLLSAPKRATGLGVTYQRAAKQVGRCLGARQERVGGWVKASSEKCCMQHLLGCVHLRPLLG